MNDSTGKRFLSNMGLRLLALVLAVLMWFFVTNYDNPVKRIQFSNVPVRLINTGIITGSNEVYTVLDGTDTIPTVTVTAPRSTLDMITEDSITAVADLQYMTADGSVPITVNVNRYSDQIESVRPSIPAVRLSIEERMRQVLTLRATTSGEPAEGYFIGDKNLDQNQIRVSGPASVVGTIRSAEAIVDVSGASGNISTSVDITLLDAEGNAVDQTNLTLNISSVKVTVVVLPTKEVPFSAVVTGTPANGYGVRGEPEFSPESVVLAGRQAVLATVESVAMAEGAVDVTGLKEDLRKSFDIRALLPENTQLVDKEQSTVIEMVVHVEALKRRNMQLPMAQIEATGVPEGYTLEFEETESLGYQVRGFEDEVDALDPQDVQGSVDIGAALQSMNPETEELFMVPIQVELPEGLELTGEVRTQVRLVPED